MKREKNVVTIENKNETSTLNVLKINDFANIDFSKQKIDYSNFQFYVDDLKNNIKSLKIEKNDVKRQLLIDDCKRFCKIENLLKKLHDAKIKTSSSSSSICKYLRSQLRKNNHYGATRKRTYCDKNDKNKIVIIEKIETKTSNKNNVKK